MKTGMFAALLALIATLTGCASTAATAPLEQRQQVAVLLDRDAATTLAQLPAHTHVMTLQQAQAYDWLARSLDEVTFYEDLDALLADRPERIVLLDTRGEMTASRR